MTGKPVPPDAGHLLVVDDDDRLRALLKTFLGRAGYRVTTAADAESARRMVAALDFDLVVLDVMMPGEDGVAFTRWLRSDGAAAAKRTPVLMLTALGVAKDRIEGLSAGADDYLGKPFEPQELLLRISAILRRAGRREAVSQVSLGAFQFDLERGELTRDGALVRLTEAETALLRRLAQAAHTPVDRFELAGEEADAAGRAIDVQVTRLRRKLEDDPKTPRYLRTVRGVGYMLAPD